MKENEEVSQDPDEIKRAERLLIDAQKEKDDGSESPPAGAEPGQE